MAREKLGPAKRFGPRYGLKPKRRVDEIERLSRKKYRCPSCGSVAVKRIAAGIWKCRKCGFVFASKAYTVEV